MGLHASVSAPRLLWHNRCFFHALPLFAAHVIIPQEP